MKPCYRLDNLVIPVIFHSKTKYLRWRDKWRPEARKRVCRSAMTVRISQMLLPAQPDLFAFRTNSHSLALLARTTSKLARAVWLKTTCRVRAAETLISTTNFQTTHTRHCYTELEKKLIRKVTGIWAIICMIVLVS